MKNSTKFIFLILLVFLICACKATPNPIEGNQSFTINDALNRDITFTSAPQRIVIGGSGSLMIVDAVYAFPEAKDHVVAYAKTDQGHGSFTELLDPDGLATVIDNRSSAEETLTYKPDVVILKSYMKDMGDSLEALGVPVVYVDFETVEQYQRDLANLGLILQNPDRAQELYKYFDEIVTKVSTKTSNLTDSEKPSVLFLYYSSKDGDISFNVPPLSWTQTRMIETAGGVPVWNNIQLEEKWTKVNFEQIAAWNPEMVFITAYFDNVSEVKSNLLQNSQWQELQAVKDSHIYAFPMEFYSWDQPHTRWGLAQQWLASKIHPELFYDFNFVSESEDTYHFLYGFSAEDFYQIILPKFQGDYQ